MNIPKDYVKYTINAHKKLIIDNNELILEISESVNDKSFIRMALVSLRSQNRVLREIISRLQNRKKD